MYDVGIITNIPSPYRLPLFERLACEPDIQLTVYFCAGIEPNRQWNSTPSGFKHVLLRGTSPRGFYHVNPGVLVAALRHRVLIVGGWGYPSVQMAISVRKLTRRAYVMWLDGVGDGGGAGGRRSWMARKLLIEGASAYLVSGTRASRWLQAHGIESERIFSARLTCDVEWMASEVDKARAKRGELRAKLGIQGPTVLFVGRLIRAKGVFDLLEAVARVVRAYPDRDRCMAPELVFVGYGPEDTELVRRAREMGIGRHVRVTGYVEPERLPEYYAIADIFVLPTYRDLWGLVINEAMAAKLPVVTTSAAGAAEDLVSEDVNGFVVPPGDVDELTRRLSMLVLDAELRLRFAEGSRLRISRWTIAESVSGIRRALEFVSENTSDES